MKFSPFKNLIDDEKILKSVSQPKCKIDIRYDDYTQVELLKKAIEYDSPIHLGFT